MTAGQGSADHSRRTPDTTVGCYGPHGAVELTGTAFLAGVRAHEPVLALPAALSQDDGLEGCVQGEKAQGRLKHTFLLR